MKISLILITLICVVCLFGGCADSNSAEIKSVLSSPDTLSSAKGEENTEQKCLTAEWPTEGPATTLPCPPFDDIILSVHTDDHLEVTVIGETAESIKEYLNAVREFGYCIDENMSESDILGVELCSFVAENDMGFRFQLNYTAGVCTFTVSAPAES